MKSILKSIGVAGIIIGISGQVPLNAALYPVPEWTVVAKAEDVGMSTTKLATFKNWCTSVIGRKAYGAVIIRYGKIAFEQYGAGATANTAWDVGSIRKPVYNGLLGMALEEKRLSLETNVYSVWPPIFEITKAAKDKNILMRHLMTATSGWGQSDLVSGQVYLYHNNAFTAGHCVIGRVYGQPNDFVNKLVETRIKNPVGAKSWLLNHLTDPWDPWTDKRAGPKLQVISSMRDLARYGYLWLRNGNWNGQQIIPSAYVAAATKNQVSNIKVHDSDVMAHYGYFWFVNDNRVLLPNTPSDAYFHTGSGDNNRKTVLAIIPSLGLVAVVGHDQDVFNESGGSMMTGMKGLDSWLKMVTGSITGHGTSSIPRHASVNENEAVQEQQQLYTLTGASVRSAASAHPKGLLIRAGKTQAAFCVPVMQQKSVHSQTNR